MRTFPINAVLAALSLLLSGVCVMAQTPAAPAPAANASAPAPAGATVRPDLGKQLIDAQTLLNDKKYAEARARLKLADAFADKTPYENYLIAL